MSESIFLRVRRILSARIEDSVGAMERANSDGTMREGIRRSEEIGAAPTIQERLLCEMCAQAMQLPKTPAEKGPLNIFQMLHSASRTRRRSLPACGKCGMDLEEFRRRGRLRLLGRDRRPAVWRRCGCRPESLLVRSPQGACWGR